MGGTLTDDELSFLNGKVVILLVVPQLEDMTAPDRLSQAYFSATSGNPWTDSVSKIFTSLHARTKAAGP